MHPGRCHSSPTDESNLVNVELFSATHLSIKYFRFFLESRSFTVLLSRLKKSPTNVISLISATELHQPVYFRHPRRVWRRQRRCKCFVSKHANHSPSTINYTATNEAQKVDVEFQSLGTNSKYTFRRPCAGYQSRSN